MSLSIKKLIMMITSMLFATIALVASIFAWFSQIDEVEANGIVVNISTNNQIVELTPTVYELNETVNGYSIGNELTENLHPYNNRDGKSTVALVKIDYLVTEAGYYTIDFGYSGNMYNYSSIKFIDTQTPVETELSNVLSFWNVNVDGSYYTKDGISNTFLHYNDASQQYMKDIRSWRVKGSAIEVTEDQKVDGGYAGTEYIIIDYSEMLVTELYTILLNNAEKNQNVTVANFKFNKDLLIMMDVSSENEFVEPDVFYNLTYDANGGVGSVYPQTVLSTSNVTLEQNVFVKNNYVLVGWYTDDGNGNIKNYSLGQNVAVRDLYRNANNEIVLYANWQATAYQIKYNKNSNTATGSITNQYTGVSGTTMLANEGFKDSYKKLVGWNTKADGTGTTYSLGQNVNIDALGLTNNSPEVTLYAMWEDNYCTVVFNKGHADATGTMENQKLDLSVNSKLNANMFLRTGYAFLGWALEENGEVVYTDQQLVSQLANNGETVNLYAVWTFNSYTIEFNNNPPANLNGEDIAGTMNEQTVLVGASVQLNANNFTHSKYVFLGWSTNPNATTPEYGDRATVRDLTTIGESITLYAIWRESFTISFENNGFGDESAAIPNLVKVPNNLPELAEDGYHFFGWYTDQSLTNKVVINSDLLEDLTLYAKWQRVLYQNDFTNQSNILSGYQGKYAHQDQVDWNEGINLYVKHKTSSTDEIAQNISVYTQDTTTEGNALVVNNGRLELIDTNNVLATNAYLELEDPIKTSQSQTTVVYGKVDITFITDIFTNVSFFNIFGEYNGVYGELIGLKSDTDDVIKYRVNGASTLTEFDASLLAQKDVTITLEFIITFDQSAPTIELRITSGNNTFVQTVTDANFNSISAINFSCSEANDKRIAIDNVLVTTNEDMQPSVRFYSDSTLDEKILTSVIDSNGNVVFPSDLSKTGYVFEGWFLLDGTKVTSSYQFDKASRVYGKLTPITYTIKFNANGAQNSMADLIVTYDIPTKLTPCAFIHTDEATFAGWNTQSDGKGTAYSNGEEILNLANTQGAEITLYAIWTKSSSRNKNIRPENKFNQNNTSADSVFTLTSAGVLYNIIQRGDSYEK